MAKKGECLSKETKQKISDTRKNGYIKGKYKIVKYWEGKKFPEKMRDKIVKSLLGNKRCLGKRWTVPQRRNPYKLEKYQIRKSVEYRNWRTKVFERDNYICQVCKKRSGNLVADHLKPFTTILLMNSVKTLEDARNCYELWEIENGKTLCLSCHYKTKTYGWGTYRINKTILKNLDK